MNAELLYEIIKKLNGSIRAVGSCEIDNERFENLEIQCKLVQMLLEDIIDESENKDSYMGSVKASGIESYSFLKDIREMLDCYFEEVEEND